MKVFCFIAWLDRCSFHRQVLVQTCSSPKYYPCASNCIDSYEQSKLTITSYPPCRGIWGRTSDKDQLNIIFTGIWTKSWFFGRKQDTQVVFWLGVITAKEEKEEEKKKKKGSREQCAWSAGCHPTQLHTSVRQIQYVTAPLDLMPLVWVSRSFSFPSLHKIWWIRMPLCVSQLPQELQGLDPAHRGLNFQIPRNEVPLPATGRNAILQSQVTAWVQAAPAEKAAQRDTEKGAQKSAPSLHPCPHQAAHMALLPFPSFVGTHLWWLLTT